MEVGYTPTMQDKCRNHPKEEAPFFIKNEPWNKMCKQCALNRALCGNIIERELNAEEMQNKMALSLFVEELKDVILSCEENSKECAILSDRFKKEETNLIVPVIEQIDSFIESLTKIKSSIVDGCQARLVEKINYCLQNQSWHLMDYAKFKEHLDRLETNYADIISKEPKTANFHQEFGVVRAEIQKVKRYSSLEEKLEKVKIVETIEEIKEELKLHVLSIRNENSKYLQNLACIESKLQKISPFESHNEFHQSKKITCGGPTNNLANVSLKINNIITNKAVPEKSFLTHRKKKSCSIGENKTAFDNQSIFTRTPGQAIIGYKRNSSGVKTYGSKDII